MSSDPNQFNLSSRAAAGAVDGPAAAYTKVVLSPEEQKAKLSGYTELPQHLWKFLKRDTHVRYYHKTDGYRPGGFISGQPFTRAADGPDSTKYFIKIRNGFFPKGKGYVEFVVAYEDVSKLFMKPDAGAAFTIYALECAAAGFNEQNKKMSLKVKDLEGRLRALETRLS